MIADAFHEVCDQATLRAERYVTLYRKTTYYGGPEEGGWWGHDNELVATQMFPTEEQAEEAKERVEELAQKQTREAQMAHSRAMADSCDWLDQRGLDADFLPEPDGPDEYFVAVEEQPGSLTSQGPRHYE